MLAQMSASQLDHWWWHSQLKPFGFDWQDYRQASLKHLLIQIARNGKSDISLHELMYSRPHETAQEQTPEEIKAAMRSAFKVVPKHESQ